MNLIHRVAGVSHSERQLQHLDLLPTDLRDVLRVHLHQSPDRRHQQHHQQGGQQQGPLLAVHQGQHAGQHGCQMALAKVLDRMSLALWA